MSEKASNVASGSGQQPQSEKRKTTSTKECMTGSTPEKKRFTPTIPPKRDRVTVNKSEPLKDGKSDANQPDTVPQRENCGRGYVRNVMGWRADQGYQPHPENKPPLPRRQYVQSDGGVFSQGVSNKVDFDPIKYALSAVDKYESVQKTNKCSHASVSNPSSLPTVIQREESHQMDQFVLQTGSQIKNEEQVIVNQKMNDKLKQHQREGIEFMWNCCFKTNSNGGCIIAHCMGLGKSLQVVTLCHTVLTNALCKVNRVMVVCPLGTVLNWENEFKIWLPGDSFKTLNVCEVAKSKDKVVMERKILRWFEIGGVLIIGYDTYRMVTKVKKQRSEQEERLWQALVASGPDLLVCDEGHLLKNEDTLLYKALNRISTRRRIMLSGTPLQNNLMEFFSMVQFVNRGLLGTNTQFEENFVKVFVKGQTVDSELSDVRAMKVRSFILHKTLENTLQRLDINVLTPFLPPKLEYVVSVRLSELQIKLYKYYLENFTKGSAVQPTESKVVSAGLFHYYQKLSQICTHPKALILAVSKTEEESDLEEKQELADQASSSTWWSDLVSDDEMNKIDHGGKILLLMDILRRCEKIGDKLLVFSQSLATLDLIEEFLANNASEVSKTWNLNKDYFRMDGSTKPEKRLEWGTAFNDPKNPRARLFLTSTKAGGIGINLKGANRVVIFDVSWNPSVDEQSVFRAYRLGQHKSCYVYRFVAQGTMEEIIFYRQVEKLALSRRIVDGEQTERHFASNDLKYLYAFDPDGLIRLPDSDLGHEKFLPPKDDLLRELMEGMGKWIGGYREHDCLLQNRPEDHLDDGEQEAIWKIFQTKKGSFCVPEVPK